MLRQVVAIVEASDAAIFSTTPDGTVLTWNRGAARMTGVEPERAVGRPLARLMPEADAGELESALLRAVGGEVVTWHNSRLLGPENAVVAVSLILAPIPDRKGRVAAVAGIGRQAAELQSVDRAIAEAEARWRHLIEHSPDNLMVTDQNGIIRYVNRTSLGFSRESLIGRHAFEFVDDAARQLGRRAYEKALSSGQPVDLEIAEDQAAGSDETRWYWVRLVPFVEPDGSATLVLSFRNITERKRLEAALRESEERYRLATEAGRMVVWKADLASGRIEHHGRAMPFGGYTATEVATLDALMGITHPEDQARVLEAWNACVEGTVERYDIEYRILARDGRVEWLAVQGGAMRGGDGRATTLIGTARDVTEQKDAQDRERALEAKLQQSQKLESLGVLAGGIAHDFNNLLTSILGNADLALMDIDPLSPARRYIETALQSARRAAELTQQMLAYSGKGRFVVQPVNLAELVRDMTPLLQASVSKRCSLRFALAPQVPMIEADVTQLRQVLMNLLTNASEALGERDGDVTVAVAGQYCDHQYLSEADLGGDNPEGDYAFLEVRDSGVGMTPEVRARIFDPFFSTKFTGRGLGLPAVLGIVRGHRGAIRVKSQPGGGTVFRVLFPVGQKPVAEHAGAVRRPQGRSQGLVLVVDDEDPVRRLACDMMQRLGFDVVSAADGEEALERFRTRPAAFTFVLLDLTMPRLDGEQCVVQLREIRADVPIVLMSGYNQQTITSRLAGLGLAGFLQKPYRFEDLAAAVRRAVRPARP